MKQLYTVNLTISLTVEAATEEAAIMAAWESLGDDEPHITRHVSYTEADPH